MYKFDDNINVRHKNSCPCRVLIGKISFFTYSFTATTLLDVLDKNRYQRNTS